MSRRADDGPDSHASSLVVQVMSSALALMACCGPQSEDRATGGERRGRAALPVASNPWMLRPHFGGWRLGILRSAA